MKATTPTRAKGVIETDRKVTGFLSVGRDGLYFHNAILAAKASITASACLEARASFTVANGFKDKAIANMVVNRQGQTCDEILAATGENLAKGEYMALHFRYNGFGKIVSIRPVSFEIVQYAKPDDLNNISRAGIFPYMASTLYKNKAKKPSAVLDLFNPDPDVVLSQMAAAGGIEKWQGQLLFDPLKKPVNGYYHVANWMEAGIDDIETEHELSVYDHRTVLNGFSGSGFLVVVEEPVETTNNDDDEFTELDDNGNAIVRREPLQRDSNDIENQMVSMMGNREAGNTMVLRFKDKETAAAARWIEASASQLANRYSSTAERVKVNISTVMKTPGELANVRRAGGMTPTGDEVRVASQLMQATVNPWQRKITQTFERIFQHWHRPMPSMDFTIENLNYFTEKTTDDNATLAN